MNSPSKKVFTYLEEYIKILLENTPRFTGSITLNFKEGKLMDTIKKEREKFPQ